MLAIISVTFYVGKWVQRLETNQNDFRSFMNEVGDNIENINSTLASIYEHLQTLSGGGTTVTFSQSNKFETKSHASFSVGRSVTDYAELPNKDMSGKSKFKNYAEDRIDEGLSHRRITGKRAYGIGTNIEPINNKIYEGSTARYSASDTSLLEHIRYRENRF